MKDKEYFFHPEWKTRKKKFLRLCGNCEFDIVKTAGEKTEQVKRIQITELK